ncbi:MAG TPA: YaaA family protein [Candidatus Parabacteroides intestinipullorum]|uniref:UPF0246 protein H9977_11265 n=1 Tax=Candidatus Parabacteroides intestinipullorum TaxID=2838723 RepID=A0A9D1X9W0_9BACT|nr:YaaA family protein [Candidatus Parabacteroides intestinipullorum]
MQIILSPAKTMTGTTDIIAPQGSTPRFQDEAQALALLMAQLPSEDLAAILKISPKVAADAYWRFQEFHSTERPGLQAILAYTGVVFQHLQPADFTTEEFLFAQKHLKIASGCYGTLRALDLIKPYRMEFNTKVPDLPESIIANFWKERQTQTLIDDIRNDDGLLVNLASQDIQPAFHWKRIASETRIITPDFKVYKQGKQKTIVIYAKMARGEMTRYIIKRQITDVEALKEFQWEGFTYKEELSTPNNWVFLQE